MTAPDERRGRRWLVWSFLACPCHLPLTLGVLGTVAGGTALGALLRRHTLLAGLIVAGVWVAGTARGFLLIRRAQRDGLTCAVRTGAPRSTSRTGRVRRVSLTWRRLRSWVAEAAMVRQEWPDAGAGVVHGGVGEAATLRVFRRVLATSASSSSSLIARAHLPTPALGRSSQRPRCRWDLRP